MTIRRNWVTNIPILGWEIKRTKVLRPGHSEHVEIHGGSFFRAEEQSEYRSFFILSVDSNDAIILVPVPNDWVSLPDRRDQIARFCTKDLRVVHADTLIYRRDEINSNLIPADGKTEIKWEPTLPPQARR